MAEMILRDAIAKALREALDTDDRTFLMGEDIGNSMYKHIKNKI